MYTSPHTAKCHLCDSEIFIKKSEDRGWLSTYCEKCLTQVSMRGKKGQQFFIDKYVNKQGKENAEK